jgi:hypothetical protein
MKIKILKDFKYGSVSDPQSMIKGNIQEVPDGVGEKMLGQWISMKWVEMVE